MFNIDNNVMVLAIGAWLFFVFCEHLLRIIPSPVSSAALRLGVRRLLLLTGYLFFYIHYNVITLHYIYNSVIFLS